MTKVCRTIPYQAGIGLRVPHFQEFLEKKPAVSWIEVHPENLKLETARKQLEIIRQDYPLSLHSLSLSLAGEKVPLAHLDFLKILKETLDPGFISDHLAWSSFKGESFCDLLPFPYTRTMLRRVVENIQIVQEVLKERILIENPATYMTFRASQFLETDFLKEVLQQSGCQLLLDVTNLYLQCKNHGGDPKQYCNEILEVSDAIAEIHLGGYSTFQLPNEKIVFVDTHDHGVEDVVWDLYQYMISKIGPRPTLIEWDQKLPDLTGLLTEKDKASYYLSRCAE